MIVFAAAAIIAAFVATAPRAAVKDLAPGASANRVGTLAFEPVADAFVSAAKRRTNFGAARTLRVDRSPVARTYLRFNVRHLTGDVATATLRLYALGGSPRGYRVNVASNRWRERTITYANAPSFRPATGSSRAFRRRRWTSVDVTSLVGGEGRVTFVLTTRDAGGFALASRERGPHALLRISTREDKSAPQRPRNLHVTGTTGTNASLAWGAARDNVGVAGYRVYADGTAVATTRSTSYTVTGLSCETAHSFAVEAFDAAGNVSRRSDTTASTTACASVADTACGTAAGPPTVWQHVVWIVMENKTYAQVIGSSNAPYINSIARRCGLATQFFAEAHPSLANYIAMTSGSTQGITDDGDPLAHPLSVPSIFSQLGSGWRSLEESMPSNCYLFNSGLYVVRHNPAAYYTNIRTPCASQDVPLTDPPDLSARFTFITPNLCNDMHSCPSASTIDAEVRNGDTWLSTWLPKIFASPEYRSGSTAVFLTWDEDDFTDAQHIPTLVMSPSVQPGTTSSARFNHYSLLRTTEEMLGITTFLGNAASAASMRSAFGL